MPRTTRLTAGMDWEFAKADPVAFARQLLRTPAGDPIVPQSAQRSAKAEGDAS